MSICEDLGRGLCAIGVHSLECIDDTYVHRYYVCRRSYCDYREVRKVAGGHQPIRRGWSDSSDGDDDELQGCDET